MSSADHNPDATGQGRARRASPATDRLAHELAGLLDGSLRNVNLAITRLRRAGAGDSATLLHNLDAANHGLQQMAALIQQWSGTRRSGASLFVPTWTLGETIQHAVQLVQPVAQSRSITIRIGLTDDLAALPAGPLYTAIANGLRNGIEAMAHAGGHIELDAQRTDGDLTLTLTDTGPGLSDAVLDERGRFRFGRTTKPTGHGLGLRLAREAMESVDGSLTLHNRPEGGAVLTLCCPVAALGEPSPPDANG